MRIMIRTGASPPDKEDARTGARQGEKVMRQQGFCIRDREAQHEHRRMQGEPTFDP
jgi:hypothetical protein